MSDETQPLPCPFCGGTPEVVDLCGWEILCRDCGASMCDTDDASREGAIAAWNRRTPIVSEASSASGGT